MAAAGGIWGGRRAALAACRGSFPSLSPVGCAASGGLAGRGGGADPQPGRAARAVGPRLLGRLGRREPSWRRTIGRIWGGGVTGRSPSVCARMGGLWAEHKNFTRAHSLPPRGPRRQPVCKPEMQRCLLIFLKENLGPHIFSGVGVDVCMWGGSDDQPVPGRASVPVGGGVSLQKRRPPASVYPFVD